MKPIKFLSIMTMFVMLFCTTFAVTSCGGDDDDAVPSSNQEKRNAIVINGVSSEITRASISLEDGISQIHFYTSTSNIEIKFSGSEIPMGNAVEAHHVELEQTKKIVEDGPYKLSIIVADDGTYTVDLPESKGSYNGKETRFSVYYKGKITINDYRGK